MVFAYTWNGTFESQPADSEDLSLGAGRTRDLKKAISERGEIDHHWDGGTDDGEHKKVTFGNQIADPSNVANKGFLYTKDVSAKVELFWQDEDGNVYQITSAGRLLVAADIQNQAYSFDVDTGAADAYEITLVPAVTAYVEGQRFSFRAANPNTGNSTLDAGPGVKTIRKYLDGVAANLELGDIVANQVVEVVYSGGVMRMVSPFANLPPVRVATYDFTDTGDTTPGSNVPVGDVWSSSQAIVIPTKGLVGISFHGRVNNTSGGTRKVYIGIRIDGTNYWPLVNENGSPNYQPFGPDTNIQSGEYRIIGGSFDTTVYFDIEGRGISTGSQTVQPIVSRSNTGITLDGSPTTARLKVAVFDMS